MSLNPEPIGPVPEETARVAQAAFPLGNVYLRLHDAFGSMYQDEAFTALFATLTKTVAVAGLASRSVSRAKVPGRTSIPTSHQRQSAGPRRR